MARKRNSRLRNSRRRLYYIYTEISNERRWKRLLTKNVKGAWKEFPNPTANQTVKGEKRTVSRLIQWYKNPYPSVLQGQIIYRPME